MSSVQGRLAEGQHVEESRAAKAVEKRTAQLPQDAFLWAAGGSIALSLTMRMMGRRDDAVFIGQWAPTFLILGLYNKFLRTGGSQNSRYEYE